MRHAADVYMPLSTRVQLDSETSSPVSIVSGKGWLMTVEYLTGRIGHGGLLSREKDRCA